MFDRDGDSRAATADSGTELALLATARWLAALDIPAADGGTLLHGLQAVRQIAAWAAGCQMRLLAAADAVHPAGGAVRTADYSDKDYFSEEVGAVLSIDGWLAQSMMQSAAELVIRLPDTLNRLEQGAITANQARLLAEAITALPDEAATQVEQRVLPRAGGQTFSQFRRAVARAVNRVAPKVAEQARAEAILGRRVCFRPAGDGMTTMTAWLPIADAARLEGAINHLAQARPAAGNSGGADGGQWTVGSRRADALVELADRYLKHPGDIHPGDEHPGDEPSQRSDPSSSRGSERRADRRRSRSGPVTMRPQIQVTVALSTLLGQDDHPGELSGHGSIPASVARELAADPNSTWQRLITDPAGRLIDYGRTVYRPPADLDHYIRAKYQTCTYPTCSRRADTSELDHVIPWSEGGPTNADNLIPLCLRHHHLKHEAGWTIKHHPRTGTTEWTSPHGRHYTNIATELPTGEAA